MSTVMEIKTAAQRLSAQDRWELYRWLGQAVDLQEFQLETLRRDIALGIEQADRGETAPLDVNAIKDVVRHRLAAPRRH